VNSFSIVLLVLAGCCVIHNIVVQLMIYAFLSQKGYNPSFLFLRVRIFKYLSQYKAITLNEQGAVGTLFYQFYVSINLALLFAVLGLIVHVLTQ